jgi:hypothetical protein
MDIQWIRIASWHAARPRDYTESAYCGRDLTGRTEVSDELPSGKSCESCLRIVAHLNDDAAKAVA